MLLRTAVLIVAMLALAACGGGRFAGLNNCSADVSPVWFEYPNSKGEYEGLNNGPCRPAS